MKDKSIVSRVPQKEKVILERPVLNSCSMVVACDVHYWNYTKLCFGIILFFLLSLVGFNHWAIIIWTPCVSTMGLFFRKKPEIFMYSNWWRNRPMKMKFALGISHMNRV